MLPFLLLFLGRAYSQNPDAFNPSADASVFTTALQSDGKIIIGGSFTNIAGKTRYRIARLNADGSLDPSLNVGLGGGDVYALAVQGDGRILVGGVFSRLILTNGVTGPNVPYLFRYNQDGTPDLTFHTSADSLVTGLCVQPDNRVLVQGYFSTLGGQTRLGLGRLLADGSLDTNFNAQVQGWVRCISVQRDGGILVGGGFGALAGHACTNLGRLKADGTLDNTFLQSFGGPPDCMLLQPDGKIVVAGQGSDPTGQTAQIARLNADGTKDGSFTLQPVQSGPADGGSIYSMALQANGAIAVGGSFLKVGNYLRTNLVWLNSNGTVNPEFRPTAAGDVFSLALQGDGKLVVAGSFFRLAGQERHHVGRLTNSAPGVQDISFLGSAITWHGGVSGPMPWRLAFETSSNGVDWSVLGEATPISGGWQLSCVPLGPGMQIRARGSIYGAYQNGSSWLLESTAFVPPALTILTCTGHFGFVSNRFGFRFTGGLGQTVVIESSEDMSTWDALATNTFGADPIDFSDLRPPAPFSRFYRLQSQP